MTLRDRVKAMFGFGRKEPDVTDQALQAVRDVKQTTAELDEKLKPYLEHHDPFAAMVGDMYNLGQISRVYRGPEK